MSDELTTWFPPEIKPVHVGVYQTKMYGFGTEGFSLWTGKKWKNQYLKVEAAAKDKRDGIQEKMWRGLAEKPK